jgi:hypothetical protein
MLSTTSQTLRSGCGRKARRSELSTDTPTQHFYKPDEPYGPAPIDISHPPLIPVERGTRRDSRTEPDQRPAVGGDDQGGRSVTEHVTQVKRGHFRSTTGARKDRRLVGGFSRIFTVRIITRLRSRLEGRWSCVAARRKKSWRSWQIVCGCADGCADRLRRLLARIGNAARRGTQRPSSEWARDRCDTAAPDGNFRCSSGGAAGQRARKRSS